MRTRLALLALLPLALSGCVAAIIPLAAGGVIAGKDRIGGKSKDSAEPVTEAVMSGASIPGPSPKANAVTPRVPAKSSPTDTLLSGEFVVLEGATSLPAPSGAATNGRSVSGAATGSYAKFFSHALAMAQRDPIDEPRKSALLAAPGSLAPATRECGILPPAVLIDLDPEGGVFNPEMAGSPNPELAAALTTLRRQDVEVFWASALSAAEAGTVRRGLVNSGLDPAGRDPLLLIRRSEDRKQTRRAELAQTHCVIAIAGDTRADFDELFLYLKDPATAAPLDALINDGWFLTPLPFDPTKG